MVRILVTLILVLRRMVPMVVCRCIDGLLEVHLK